VGATIGNMSIVIVIWSLGCILGSFAVGLLMDRFTRYK
jgi:MFS family permease